MKEAVKIILISLAGYLVILSGKLTQYIYPALKNIDWVKAHSSFVYSTIGNLIWLASCLLFTYFLLRYFIKNNESITEALGLKNNITIGIGIGLLFTLPMIIGYSFKGGLQSEIKAMDLLLYSGYAGFFEELIYRGFFIGLLYRYTRLGFFPIVLLVSPIFGAAHLYQATSFMHGLSVVLITSLGSMFFAWLFMEYKWNLWVPITMHILMNACWAVFDLQATDAAGNTFANTFRFFTIGFATLFTLVKIRKQGSALKGKLIWSKA